MSLILDALNKADRERDPRDAVPDINTVHGGVRRAPDHRRLLWVAGALGALVVILGLLLLALWLRAPSPATATTPPAATAPAATASVAPASRPAIPETVAPPPVQPAAPTVAAAAEAATEPTVMASEELPGVSPEVLALYEVQTDTVVQQVVEPVVQPAPAAAAVNPGAGRQTSVDEALARALWEESKRLQTTLPQPPTPAQTQAQAAAKKTVTPPPPPDPDVPLEETMAGHKKTPFLHELPVTVQDTIPTLMYAKHDFQKRQVVINKTELRMGDATNGGVLVERVLADGVLLSFNGAQFKLASLSSWVNY